MNSKYVPVRKEDTYALIEAAQQGDFEARELIVQQNTGLVKNLALKYSSMGYELDDLLQIGFIGLLKAIERFDTGFDVMFSTYAVPMILGEIKRYIRDDGNIKVSRQLKTDMRNLRLIREEYYNRTGNPPKLSYLAEKINRESEEERNVSMIDLKNSISMLGERERQIIVLRYFKDMTQQQVAEKVGISQVQVSRIEKRVLQELREKME